MPLVTSKKMLADAQKGGYAVGAFNAENMEMVLAIIEAAVAAAALCVLIDVCMWSFGMVLFV